MADRSAETPPRYLPPLAIGVFAIVVAAVLWAAWNGGTFACDYLAYDSAIRRFLSGGTLYIRPFDPTGPCGYFYYPPPFVILALPLMLVPAAVAGAIATAGLIVAFLLGVRLLPVRPPVTWAVLLLGGLSWPLVYAIKLGQVGPVLFLVFAAGWRWMDRPVRLASAIALGTAIKVQPALLFGWAFFTGRRRAAYVAVAIFAVLAFAATLVAGPAAWVDEINLLIGRSRPVYTEGLVTPGRLAVDAGLSELGGWAVELTVWAATATIVVFVLLRGSATASYLSVVIASQFISPILWNHYALVLLLPVAWLLERRWWVAAVIPLLSSAPLVLVTPPVVYPVEYLAALVLVAIQGVREAREPGVGRGWRWLAPEVAR